MTSTSENQEPEKKKRRVARSPAYPSFHIEKALMQVKSLYDNEGDYAAPLPSAMNAWGYSPKSSSGRQTLATLKYYGLIEVTGEADTRMIKTSELARKILLDQREDKTEKKQLIRRSALTPSAHKTLFGQYPDGLASDGTVKHFLVMDQGFSQEAASDLLMEYKQTSDYAKIYKPSFSVDKMDKVNDSGGEEKGLPQVEVGNTVQWTSGGVDMFTPLATVLGLSDDGLWVFTDKGDAAVPLKEITVSNPQEPSQPVQSPPPIPAHILAAREIVRHDDGGSLKKNQTVLSQGKLKSGAFEVRVTGEIGAKEIGKIIKLLEAQKMILEDD